MSIMKPPLGVLPRPGHWASQGLVGCWLFNEGAGPLGRAMDLSGNGNHGTLVGDTHSVPGKFGPGLKFDGTGDNVQVGGAESLDLVERISIFAWIKPAINLANSHTVLAKRVTGTETTNYMVQYSTPLTFWIFNGGFVGGEWSKTPPTDVWTHIAVTYDTAQIITYFNGTVDTITAETTAMLTNAASLNIGVSYPGHATTPFNGQIGNVMIYNRALSAAAVLSLYRDSFQMLGRDPIELWAAATSGGAAPSGIAVLRRRIEAA